MGAYSRAALVKINASFWHGIGDAYAECGPMGHVFVGEPGERVSGESYLEMMGTGTIFGENGRVLCYHTWRPVSNRSFTSQWIGDSRNLS